jgi:hypothetical protein
MGAEKITFCLKRYLSKHTCIFGILNQTSCLSRMVTSTAVFSPVAKEKVSLASVANRTAVNGRQVV